jgi:hypothetical protein
MTGVPGGQRLEDHPGQALDRRRQERDVGAGQPPRDVGPLADEVGALGAAQGGQARPGRALAVGAPQPDEGDVEPRGRGQDLGGERVVLDRVEARQVDRDRGVGRQAELGADRRARP